jgi:hypothetical protein
MGKLIERIGLDILLIIGALILTFAWLALWAWASITLGVSSSNSWDLAVGLIGAFIVMISPFYLYMFLYRKNYAQKIAQDSSSAWKFAMVMATVGVIIGIRGTLYPSLVISIILLIVLYYSGKKK